MRQFVLLLFAFILALYGLNSLADTEALSAYIVRDSLLISGLAMLLFAIGSIPLFTNQSSLAQTGMIAFGRPRPNRNRWRIAKTILTVIGLLCALAGALLFVIADGGAGGFLGDTIGNVVNNIVGGMTSIGPITLAPLRIMLWVFGIFLFALGMFWRTRDIYKVPILGGSGEQTGASLNIARSGDVAGSDDAARLDNTQGMPKSQNAILTLTQNLISRGLIRVLLWTIIAIGALLRYWAMKALPLDCVGAECIVMINVMGEQGTPQTLGAVRSLFEMVATTIYTLVEPGTGLMPLRSMSLLIGVATLPAFYGFASRLVKPIGALAATAILAIHPWHVSASSVADAAISIPLLLSMGLWCLLAATDFSALGQNPTQTLHLRPKAWRRWSTASGILLAIASVEIMAQSDTNLLGLLLFNLLFVGLILFFAARRWFPAIWLLLGAVIAALPLLGQFLFLQTDALTESAPTAADLQPFLLDLFRNLFWRGSIGSIGPLGENSLLGLGAAALIVLGVGTLLRSVLNDWQTPTRWPAALFVLVELFFLGFITLLILHHAQTNGSVQELSSLLLIMLPLFFVAIAASLDQLTTTFAALWKQLIDPETVAIVAILGTLLLGGPRIASLMDQFGSVSLGGDAQTNSAIGRYLAERLQVDSGQSRSAGADVVGLRTYFLPPPLLNNPALRILSGPEFEKSLASGQIRGFDVGRDLLFVNTDGDELVYLVPASDQNLMMLLERVYPQGIAEVQTDERNNEPLFTAYNVSQNDLRESRGVRGFYFEGSELGTNDEAQVVVEGEAVEFDWVSQPSAVSAPFSARWEGTLLIPAEGEYTFYLDGDGIDDPDMQATESAMIWLDNIRILDSANGRTEAQQTLARGTYRIDINYQTERESPGFTILWKEPNGQVSILPQDFLQSNTIPSIGLLGTYFGNDNFQGEPLLRQKDLALGAEIFLPSPYSVRWTGQLAAPRSGEYILGVWTTGQVVFDVDYTTVINTNLPKVDETEEGEITTFDSATKALLYLERGWHDVEISYVPAEGRAANSEAPAFQLYWTQPGGEFAELESEYFAPVLSSVAPVDIPLPPPAPLLVSDPTVDESQFAFSFISDSYTKLSFQSVTPPTDLPSFNPTLIWQTQDGCGSLPNQFAEPSGVAIEPVTGQIFVADMGNRRIVQYDIESNQEVRSYTSPLFEEPFDMDIQTISGRNLPIVLDALSQQIFRIDPDAAPQDAVSPLPQQVSFYRPRGLAVDVAGNIIVADTGGGRVVIMDPQGMMLLEYGGQGSLIASGQPVDVMGGSRNLWAITAEDGRLWNLRSSQTENGSLTAVKTTSTLRGSHFAELPNGGFLLTDPTRRLILLHDPTGQPMRQFDFGDFLRKPVGIDMGMVNGLPYMSVVDMESCTLSLWQLNMSELN